MMIWKEAVLTLSVCYFGIRLERQREPRTPFSVTDVLAGIRAEHFQEILP
jgi:hypothetical protein